jgi:hypothetical protein
MIKGYGQKTLEKGGLQQAINDFVGMRSRENPMRPSLCNRPASTF